MHEESRLKTPLIENVAQPGDIVFRLSNATVLSGAVNFSSLIAELSESDFSHAVIVYDVTEHGVILADVSVNGIELVFVRDWYIDQTTNCVIKRLKPEYRHLLPLVLEEVQKLVDEDVLYDEDFEFGDNKYYCTELVDHCFRVAGLDLTEPIAIKDLPGYKWGHKIMSWISGIDVNKKVIVAGNDQIGIFASDKLETVLDLREGQEMSSSKVVPFLIILL